MSTIMPPPHTSITRKKFSLSIVYLLLNGGSGLPGTPNGRGLSWGVKKNPTKPQEGPCYSLRSEDFKASLSDELFILRTLYADSTISAGTTVSSHLLAWGVKCCLRPL